MKELEQLILSKSRPVQKEAKHIGVSELDKLIMEALNEPESGSSVIGGDEPPPSNIVNFSGRVRGSSDSEKAEHYLIAGLLYEGEINKLQIQNVPETADTSYVHRVVEIGYYLGRKLGWSLAEADTKVVGAGVGTLSAAFAAIGGVSAVSVTDILIGGKKVSVKSSEKGAQLTVLEPGPFSVVFQTVISQDKTKIAKEINTDLSEFNIEVFSKLAKKILDEYENTFNKLDWYNGMVNNGWRYEPNQEFQYRKNPEDKKSELLTVTGAFVKYKRTKKKLNRDSDGKPIPDLDKGKIQTRSLHPSKGKIVVAAGDPNDPYDPARFTVELDTTFIPQKGQGNIINYLANWVGDIDNAREAAKTALADALTFIDVKEAENVVNAYIETLQKITASETFQALFIKELTTGGHKFQKGSSAVPEYVLYFDPSRPADTGFALYKLTDDYFKKLARDKVVTFGARGGRGFQQKTYSDAKAGIKHALVTGLKRPGTVRPDIRVSKVAGTAQLHEEDADTPIDALIEKGATLMKTATKEVDKVAQELEKKSAAIIAKQSVEPDETGVSPIATAAGNLLTLKVDSSKITVDGTVNI